MFAPSPTLDGSFSAVWIATIAGKGAFFCIFRDIYGVRYAKDCAKVTQRVTVRFYFPELILFRECRQGLNPSRMRSQLELAGVVKSPLEHLCSRCVRTTSTERNPLLQNGDRETKTIQCLSTAKKLKFCCFFVKKYKNDFLQNFSKHVKFEKKLIRKILEIHPQKQKMICKF